LNIKFKISYFRAFSLYDIQFDQAKFHKLNKKGRKKNDENKENNQIDHNYTFSVNGFYNISILQSQLDKLTSLVNSYIAINNSIRQYNFVKNIELHQQQQQQQQQLFPIFNNERSILLARPQTPKPKRAPKRSKKNTPALSIE
jgi:hypothetical protein